MLVLRHMFRPVPLAAALLALALALPLQAGTPFERVPEGQDIPLADWEAMAAGRTLTYRLLDGTLFAREHYHPGSNNVTLEFSDGTCTRGTWEHVEPRYCFHWEHNGTVCFRHVRYGSSALIIQVTEDGQDTSMFQLMTEVSDTPLVCGPPLVG